MTEAVKTGGGCTMSGEGGDLKSCQYLNFLKIFRNHARDSLLQNKTVTRFDFKPKLIRWFPKQSITQINFIDIFKCLKHPQDIVYIVFMFKLKIQNNNE